ncbi:MAG TPA: DNA topoisomerase IB [Acidimicrobiia bacterium]|nr:DNA topoisomerase IB [Acidimicrobiia bacterium]
MPGIARRRAGRGFSYRWPDGTHVDDPDVLERVRALAVPPAWTDVWICPSANGHVQATGRDAAGRKQYRYHVDWRAARELAKFGALSMFGTSLPAIRRRRDRDLTALDPSHDTVTATVVELLERTMVRVGNEEYVKQNGHFGLTTLRSRHARVGRDGTVQLTFVGKSGIVHRVELRDPRVAAVIAACRKLPGEHLFQYVNGDGAVHPVSSQGVNDYLRDAAGADVTAKDFRTWMATLEVATLLAHEDTPTTARQLTRSTNAVIDVVAERLGNTRAVCRASYVHPAVLQAYADGTLRARLQSATVSRTRGISADERRLLGFLRSLESGRTRFARAA